MSELEMFDRKAQSCEAAVSETQVVKMVEGEDQAEKVRKIREELERTKQVAGSKKSSEMKKSTSKQVELKPITNGLNALQALLKMSNVSTKPPESPSSVETLD